MDDNIMNTNKARAQAHKAKRAWADKKMRMPSVEASLHANPSHAPHADTPQRPAPHNDSVQSIADRLSALDNTTLNYIITFATNLQEDRAQENKAKQVQQLRVGFDSIASQLQALKVIAPHPHIEMLINEMMISLERARSMRTGPDT